MASQVAASQFSRDGQGHAFVLRKPLAKVTAKRCAACGEDVFAHARAEVTDEAVLTILDLCADDRASPIEDGLRVGGFKAALADARRDLSVVVLNCAGTALHNFLPKTRAPFDALRTAGRVRDLEWHDRDDFAIDPADVVAAIVWARRENAAGRAVVVNCAQGKSRSGTMATAIVMVQRCALPPGSNDAVVTHAVSFVSKEGSIQCA